ncbi:MAG: mechanosensitive ion channel [Pseudomonadales bacterium]|nr:mechanosensitive ion channel [Pseudomonadales bacterium]
MENLEPQKMGELIMEGILTHGPNLLLTLVTLFGGLWLINRLIAFTAKRLENSRVEVTLSRFLLSLASVGLKALLFVSVASMVGVETTSFIAVLGAAGLAVGLALQGSLSNFAGGVLILFFKPFKVGDVIEAAGFVGKVDSIQIFSTILKTGDNRKIIVPNGVLSNNSIVNINAEPTRRVDLLFGIGYGDDIAKAKAVLEDLVAKNDKVLKDPAHLIVVSALGDSSVNFTVRLWVNTADYWDVFFGMTEAVKLRFDQEGISIPFPQRDVHLYKAD